MREAFPLSSPPPPPPLLRRNPCRRRSRSSSTIEITGGESSSVIVCHGAVAVLAEEFSRSDIRRSLRRRRPAFWLKRRDTNTHTNTHPYTSPRATPGSSLSMLWRRPAGAPPVINNGNCAKLSLGGNVRPVRSRTLRPFRTCGFYCLRCHAARSLSITIVSGDSRQSPEFRGYVYVSLEVSARVSRNARK